jgi:hypothetical protein
VPVDEEYIAVWCMSIFQGAAVCAARIRVEKRALAPGDGVGSSGESLSATTCTGPKSRLNDSSSPGWASWRRS